MNAQIDSILIPTDGSEGALIGGRRGIDVAKTVDADVHVLSVVDAREIEPPLSRLETTERTDREERIEAEARRAVDRVAGLAETQLSTRVTTAVERGVPARSVTAYAEDNDIDLIVMGTHGRSGLERIVLGSVAEKVLRSSSAPVLMVPPSGDVDVDAEQTYDDVLLPTDGSEGATVAIDWAVTFASCYDATVHSVFSVEMSRFADIDGMGDVHEAFEELGRDALDDVRAAAREANVGVTGEIGTGTAHRMISQYCDEQDVDLIVMGTHGRTGLQRYLIGSVTENVIRNADVPVCAVPME